MKGCAAETYSVCIVVENNEVTVADVEARQVVAGILGIKDVFVHDISCSSGFRCVPSEKRNKHSEHQTNMCSLIFFFTAKRNMCRGRPDLNQQRSLYNNITAKAKLSQVKHVGDFYHQRRKTFHLYKNINKVHFIPPKMCLKLSLRSDLSYWSVFPKDIVHLLSCNLVRKIPDIQDSVHLRR